MIRAYSIIDGRLHVLEKENGTYWLKDAVWIDLYAPTKKELKTIRSISDLPVPGLKQVQELESSSHHSTYDNGIQINSLFFHNKGGEAVNTNVALIVSDKLIITMTDTKIPEIRLLKNRCKANLIALDGPKTILFELLEMKVDRLADTMEDSYRRLNTISKAILSSKDKNIEHLIEALAKEDDVIGKIRLCLMDGQRDLLFLFKKNGGWLVEYKHAIQEILNDLDTLLPHNAFLSEKIDFLLNAAQGFINIQQNKIIKMFSIAAVVFLPPTLVASIYGMNFRYMPELSWLFGYPFAIILMILSGVSPYYFFKRKGWL